MLLGGSAAPELARFGYQAPFAPFVTDFAAADVVYVNLEGPVGTRGAPVAGKTYTFLMPPAVIPTLAAAGIDVLHLANNHILDYGIEALEDTLTLAATAGLATCGAGSTLAAARAPAIVTAASGVRFAFVCYSNTFPEEFYATPNRPGTAFGHAAWVRADVTAAKARADVVVAAFHWGAELMTTPKDYQRDLAAAARAAGATVVLGHHPHVLQPLELHDHGVVAYSLGNFVFGSYSSKVRTSALVRIRGRGAAVTEVSVLPLNVFNPQVVFRPRVLAADAARSVATALLQGPVVPTGGGWWQLHNSDIPPQP